MNKYSFSAVTALTTCHFEMARRFITNNGIQYVAGAAHRVIVKADFVRNNAILHSCDNLTIFFHIETLFSLFICQRSISHVF